jgi:hypothetical protein
MQRNRAIAAAFELSLMNFPAGCKILKGRSSCRNGLAALLGAVAAAASLPAAGAPCRGWWADVMIASHHIHPDRQFDDFNPGVGFECSVTPQWAATLGYFRNSLDRPSFYGGALYTPQFAHWGWFRLGAMGGIISGYNFGRFGVGANGRTGLVAAPTAIAQFGRFGLNVILVPPIPDDNLPFTLGFQAKYRFK